MGCQSTALALAPSRGDVAAWVLAVSPSGGKAALAWLTALSLLGPSSCHACVNSLGPSSSSCPSVPSGWESDANGPWTHLGFFSPLKLRPAGPGCGSVHWLPKACPRAALQHVFKHAPRMVAASTTGHQRTCPHSAADQRGPRTPRFQPLLDRASLGELWSLPTWLSVRDPELGFN